MFACTSVVKHVRLYLFLSMQRYIISNLFQTNKQSLVQLTSLATVSRSVQVQKANHSTVETQQAVRIVRDAACVPPLLSISIRAFFHKQCCLKIVKFPVELDATVSVRRVAYRKLRTSKTFENLTRLSNIHEE